MAFVVALMMSNYNIESLVFYKNIFTPLESLDFFFFYYLCQESLKSYDFGHFRVQPCRRKDLFHNWGRSQVEAHPIMHPFFLFFSFFLNSSEGSLVCLITQKTLQDFLKCNQPPLRSHSLVVVCVCCLPRLLNAFVWKEDWLLPPLSLLAMKRTCLSLEQGNANRLLYLEQTYFP